MGLFAKKKPPLRFERGASLGGRPERLPVVRTTEESGGDLRVRVQVETNRWQRWVGVPKAVERDYVLDALGREVYEACDGKANVRAIARRFAANHKISAAEAEMSVTAFLKTMTGRGLIAIAVSKHAPAKAARTGAKP